MCVCVCVYLVFVDRTVFENIIMTISTFTWVYDLLLTPLQLSNLGPRADRLSRIQHTSLPLLSGGSLQEGKNASLCVRVYLVFVDRTIFENVIMTISSFT